MDVQSPVAVPANDLLSGLRAWRTAIETTNGVAAAEQVLFDLLAVVDVHGVQDVSAARLARLEMALAMIIDVATHAAANDPQAPAAVVLTTIASTARLALHGRSR